MKNKEKILRYSSILLIVILIICLIGNASIRKSKKIETIQPKEEYALLEKEPTEEFVESTEGDITQEGLNQEKIIESENDKSAVSNNVEEKIINEANENINKVDEVIDIEKEEILEKETVKPDPPQEEIEEEKFIPIKTTAGITILSAQSYAGKYIEDGSDEIVSNVMSLFVKNTGEKEIQLADFKVIDEDGNSYDFRLTTLLPDQEMIVLERNRKKYSEEVTLVSTEITNLAVFSESPSLQEDILVINGKQNLITVTNISKENIQAVRVCYKNIFDDIYMGGITYTVSIPELAPGQSVDLPTRHYTEDASEVVFVNYAK